jgi:hypothetical protein
LLGLRVIRVIRLTRKIMDDKLVKIYWYHVINKTKRKRYVNNPYNPYPWMSKCTDETDQKGNDVDGELELDEFTNLECKNEEIN